MQAADPDVAHRPDEARRGIPPVRRKPGAGPAAALCLLAGAVLLTGSVTGVPGEPGAPAGSSDAGQDAAAPVSVAAEPGAPGDATPADAQTDSAVPPSAPARLALPTLGVTAPVEGVRTVAGVLGVPQDPGRLGRWTGSPVAGSPTGSTVIDGHVDSATRGRGAFYRLEALAVGDPVVVTGAGGQEHAYRVTGSRRYVKDRGLPAELFDDGGPARLVLVTCGGPYDSSRRSYRDNVVVLASPA